MRMENGSPTVLNIGNEVSGFSKKTQVLQAAALLTRWLPKPSST